MLELFEVSPHAFRFTEMAEMQSRLHDLEGMLSLESLLLDGDLTLDFFSWNESLNGCAVEMRYKLFLATVVEARENL